MGLAQNYGPNDPQFNDHGHSRIAPSSYWGLIILSHSQIVPKSRLAHVVRAFKDLGAIADEELDLDVGAAKFAARMESLPVVFALWH